MTMPEMYLVLLSYEITIQEISVHLPSMLYEVRKSPST